MSHDLKIPSLDSVAQNSSITAQETNEIESIFCPPVDHLEDKLAITIYLFQIKIKIYQALTVILQC